MSCSDEHLLSPHEILNCEIMTGSLKGYNAEGTLPWQQATMGRVIDFVF